MKSSWLALAVVPVVFSAGCNGSARRKPVARKAVVRRDPALEARLAGLSEQRGFKHTVAKGETLYRLSRRYKLPVPAIMAANPGLDPRNMRLGQTVVIPGVARAGEEVRVFSGPLGPKPKSSRTPDCGRLRYPVSSKYNPIRGGNPGAQFEVPSGTAVVAAAKGRVVLATSDLGGLGPSVMIDHGKGLVTMYGRLSDYAVRPGQGVKRGESIGRVGALGLLFRVYQGAVPRAVGPYIK